MSSQAATPDHATGRPVRASTLAARLKLTTTQVLDLVEEINTVYRLGAQPVARCTDGEMIYFDPAFLDAASGVITALTGAPDTRPGR